MTTLVTFGDSILDSPQYNAYGLTPGQLLVDNDDDLFPESQGRDLSARRPARLEHRARRGHTVGSLPTQAQRLTIEGRAVARPSPRVSASSASSRGERTSTVVWPRRTCPPGVRFAEQFGLYYRLRSSAEIDWVQQRNVRFPEDYLALDPASINQHSANVILELVTARRAGPCSCFSGCGERQRRACA